MYIQRTFLQNCLHGLWVFLDSKLQLRTMHYLSYYGLLALNRFRKLLKIEMIFRDLDVLPNIEANGYRQQTYIRYYTL